MELCVKELRYESLPILGRELGIRETKGARDEEVVRRGMCSYTRLRSRNVWPRPITPVRDQPTDRDDKAGFSTGLRDAADRHKRRIGNITMRKRNSSSSRVPHTSFETRRTYLEQLFQVSTGGTDDGRSSDAWITSVDIDCTTDRRSVSSVARSFG